MIFTTFQFSNDINEININLKKLSLGLEIHYNALIHYTNVQKYIYR